MLISKVSITIQGRPKPLTTLGTFRSPKPTFLWKKIIARQKCRKPESSTSAIELDFCNVVFQIQSTWVTASSTPTCKDSAYSCVKSDLRPSFLLLGLGVLTTYRYYQLTANNLKIEEWTPEHLFQPLTSDTPVETSPRNWQSQTLDLQLFFFTRRFIPLFTRRFIPLWGCNPEKFAGGLQEGVKSCFEKNIWRQPLLEPGAKRLQNLSCQNCSAARLQTHRSYSCVWMQKKRHEWGWQLPSCAVAFFKQLSFSQSRWHMACMK